MKTPRRVNSTAVLMGVIGPFLSDGSLVVEMVASAAFFLHEQIYNFLDWFGVRNVSYLSVNNPTCS